VLAPAPAPAPDTTPPPAEPKGVSPGTPVALASSPAQAMMTMNGWKATFYGFVEFDAMRDSTQSFSDGVGNTPLLRSDGSIPTELVWGTSPFGSSYAATNPRMILTPRNTQFGFRVEPPEFASVKTTAVIEFDFFGNQPTNPYSQTASNTPTSESSFLSSAAPRMRHAYVDMKTPIIDVLAGQTYHLFGWEPLFFPPTDSFLGLPNMVFDRRAQLRLTKRIETNPINIVIAGAATRGAQADSGIPDFTGGLLFQINGWKGAHMLGPGQPKHDPLSIGVSGIYRQFNVAQWVNNLGLPQTAPKDATGATGYGISIDALLPIIPVKDPKDKSNGLTVTGSFVTGTGIGDLYTGGLTGGANFPQPLSAANPFAGTYGPNIDPGVVQYAIKTAYDPATGSVTNPTDMVGNQYGLLRTIDLRTYMVGAQYYLPFLNGRFVITGNYTHSNLSNIQQLGASCPTCSTPPPNTFQNERTAGGDPTRTFKEATYYDANLFMGITDSFKVGLSWQHVEQVFLASANAGSMAAQDGTMQDSKEHNDRFEVSTFFFF
jgi:hypothetical protein